MKCRFCGKEDATEGRLCKNCKIKKEETIQRISEAFDKHKKEDVKKERERNGKNV